MMIDAINGRAPVAPPRPLTTGSVAAPVAVAALPDAGPDLSQLATVVRQMASSPPVDAAKVDRIRMQLAVGSYHADPSAIADRMVALDLSARG